VICFKNNRLFFAGLYLRQGIWRKNWQPIEPLLDYLLPLPAELTSGFYAHSLRFLDINYPGIKQKHKLKSRL